ncbi:hypothetical protein ACI6QG_02365 [Roseococcus sp. DSY-14]|uniref:hypothetical protein n=1 Tax=Roseococcus sp. DSY-14 TaxID=3369650 RepID=UPI00387AC7EC
MSARAVLADALPGLPPPAGAQDAVLDAAAAGFLAAVARAWLARARACGALSVPSGRVYHSLSVMPDSLRWEWHEAGGPAGDLGPPSPPPPHPPGLRLRRFVSPGSLGVVLDLPLPG